MQVREVGMDTDFEYCYSITTRDTMGKAAPVGIMNCIDIHIVMGTLAMEIIRDEQNLVLEGQRLIAKARPQLFALWL